MSGVSPGKLVDLRRIAEAYIELKGLRVLKQQEYQRVIEEELLVARREFADFLQALFLREGVGYKLSVADIARAMGTTNRKTVYDFLGDARERARNRFVDGLDGGVGKLCVLRVWEVYGRAYASVFDEGEGRGWLLWWRFRDGGAPVVRWQEFGTVVDEEFGSFEVLDEPVGVEVTRLLPLGSDSGERGPVPVWVEWVVAQPEWLRVAEGWVG